MPSGDLAHVILLAVLGGFAVTGHALIDGRKHRELGAACWQTLHATALKAPRFQRPRSLGDVITRLVIGLAAFVALLLAHPIVIGVCAL